MGICTSKATITLIGKRKVGSPKQRFSVPIDDEEQKEEQDPRHGLAIRGCKTRAGESDSAA